MFPRKELRDNIQGIAKPAIHRSSCDYGNTESVRVADLRRGEPRYFELAPQAVPFLLANLEASNGSEWLAKEFDLLKERIQYAEFSGQVIQVGCVGNHPVLFMFDGLGSKASLVDRLVSEGIGRNCGAAETSVGIPMTILKPGQSYCVYMAFFNSPVEFWGPR